MNETDRTERPLDAIAGGGTPRRKLSIRPEEPLADAFAQLCEQLGVSGTALLEALMESSIDVPGMIEGDPQRLLSDCWDQVVLRAKRVTAGRRGRLP